MPKYLVVKEANTGYAQISNVGIVDVKSPKEAIEEMRKTWGIAKGYEDEFYVRELDSNPNKWSYYI